VKKQDSSGWVRGRRGLVEFLKGAAWGTVVVLGIALLLYVLNH
jgi:hypothetical protein